MIKRHTLYFRKNKCKKIVRESIFMPKKYLFTENFTIYSFIDDCYELKSYERGVAQLGSAGALGALGRRFESCRPDHLKTKSY